MFAFRHTGIRHRGVRQMRLLSKRSDMPRLTEPRDRRRTSSSIVLFNKRSFVIVVSFLDRRRRKKKMVAKLNRKMGYKYRRVRTIRIWTSIMI